MTMPQGSHVWSQLGRMSQLAHAPAGSRSNGTPAWSGLPPAGSIEREAATGGTGLPLERDLAPGLGGVPPGSPAAAPAPGLSQLGTQRAAPAWRKGRTNKQRRAAWRAERARLATIGAPAPPIGAVVDRVLAAIRRCDKPGRHASGMLAFVCAIERAGASMRLIPTRRLKAARAARWGPTGRWAAARRWLRQLVRDPRVTVGQVVRAWAARWPGSMRARRRMSARRRREREASGATLASWTKNHKPDRNPDKKLSGPDSRGRARSGENIGRDSLTPGATIG